MIVDSSALLAVLLGEQDARRFVEVMADAAPLRISVANWFEAAMAIDRRGDARARSRFDQIVGELGLVVEPVTLDHATWARRAWQMFGKGAHRAKLNFGDCLAYGCAKTAGEPLLFKGDDFSQTDIEPALKV
ncbi:MAG TPA: type II toxin-antitoxin system VapC family toxin [Steroidobacteraceae bacterium]|nr:type II toxin-antitoxin system VapC family toxin [Steroidobacteraceae bacterium]